jgi:RNA-directed DNA polymerase
MSRLQLLKAATSLRDVAALVGFRTSALAYILFKKPAEAKYRTFEIKKRGGGTRPINAPSDDLRLVQRNLADVLQECVEEINTSTNRRDDIAHGFKKGRSIITNASKHRRRRYVFNIDLEDFFGTINFGRVRGFFISDRNFALQPAVATVIAQIACHGNSLPQGSPCSPIVSNLVGHLLDIRLVKLASSEGCTYSRYADDLTFSTNKREFPSAIAKQEGDVDHKWQPGDQLVQEVNRSGFTINNRKTRMQYRTSRQDVTGLVVNKKVNIRSGYRRMVRAMAHRLFTTGAFDFIETVADQNGASAPVRRPGSLEQLHGMLGHIDNVDWHNAKAASDGGVQDGIAGIGSKEHLYRSFLLYKELYAASTPTIVCEGKTDNVYLRQAILRSGPAYPELADVAPGGAVSLRVHIFQYPNTSTARILGLGGGTGDLKNLVNIYRKESDKFKAQGGRFPVILLVDNDDGPRSLISVVQQITKGRITREEDFVRIFGNLYLVFTPLRNGNEQSRIEDSFAQETKDTRINNKSFNPGNDYDTSTHYGKQTLSRYVEENAASIDFSGFDAILARLSTVVRTHN